MSRRLISYLGRKSGLYPYTSLLIVAAVTAVAAWSAYDRLQFQMDVTTLLPKDSEVAHATQLAEWDFGSHEYLLTVLEVKETAPARVRENPAEFLLDVRPHVEVALDDEMFFRPKGQFQKGSGQAGEVPPTTIVSRMTDADFTRMESGMAPERLRVAFQRIAEKIESNPTTDALLALQPDPLDLLTFSERTSRALGPIPSPGPEGVYLSEDGEMMLLVMWPTTPATDLMAVRRLRNFLLDTREGLYKRNPEWREVVDIQFTGPSIENAEGEANVRQDILTTSIVSFCAVMILFFIAFRQPEALLFVATPLIIGIIWTLGIASVFVTHITQVTLSFAAIMISLGIDFSIHLYNRYLEDIRLGRSVNDALNNSIATTGPSIVAGAITTGCAFFGMTLTRFEGFQQLGLFGGIGIVLCLLAVATTLPPLMVLFSGISRRMRAPVATLGLKKVSFTVNAYPRMTVAAGLCIVAFLGIHATKASFNQDFEVMRRQSDSYVQLVDRIESHFRVPGTPLLIIIEEDSVEAALAANDRLYNNIQSTRGNYEILVLDSLRTTFPSPSTQRQNLERMANFPIERLGYRIENLLEEYPEIPPSLFEQSVSRLHELVVESSRALREREAILSFELAHNPLFYETIQRYIISREGKVRILTRVFPRKNLWPDGLPENFVSAISTGIPNPPTILGNVVLSEELKWVITKDLTQVVLVVLVLVTSYLIFYFGNVGRALLTMIPVFFALLSMLGIMQMMGMRLNYLNVIVIPMIIGIGVDSSIHLMGRYYEDQKKDLRVAIEKTGRAIVITGLTTIFGFGALCVASFQGIREIGVLAIAGTVCTLFAALLFLPAIIRMLDPQYTYRGGAGDEIG